MRGLAAQLPDGGLDDLADQLASLWAGQDDTVFLSSVLENTFDAVPEASELDKWSDVLADNGSDLGETLLSIS